MTAALFLLFSLSSLISDIMEDDDDKNDDAADNTADTTTLNTHWLDSNIKDAEPHLHDVWQHEQKVDGPCHALWKGCLCFKPEYGEHQVSEVFKHVFNTSHLADKDIQLEPHINLHRDGRCWLHPHYAVMNTFSSFNTILELVFIKLVCQVEMRSGHKNRGVSLTLGDILG